MFKKQTSRFKTLSGSRLKASNGSRSARAVKGSSSTQRGYGYRWRKERAAFLYENPLCAMCSTPERPVVATVLDHITPHKGNAALFWDKANWQGLCAHCHSSTKQKMEIQAAKRTNLKNGGGGVES